MNDLLILTLALVAAIAVHLIVDWWLRRIKHAGNESLVTLLRRISLPALLLAASLGLKLEIVTKLFKSGPKFGLYRTAAIVFFAALFLIRLVDAWFLYRRQRKHLPPHLPKILHDFILLVLYLLVIFYVLGHNLGINISPLLTTSAIFTAIIGLAFQGVLSNVLAGISLNMTRSFSRGDWVKIGPHEGAVKEINWRETQILDRASNLIIIPNNTAASEMIVNFSQPHKNSIAVLPVKASPAASPAAVIKALNQAADEVAGVLKHPAPDTFIQSYDETGITYLLRFWINDFAQKNVITGEVARHAWYRFQRLGIEVPLPAAERVGDIVRAIRPETETAVEAGQDIVFSHLLASSLLRRQEGEATGELLVPEEEVRLLARRVRLQRYTSGEVLFRQGEKGESCFVVAEGRVKGEIVYEEKDKRYVSRFDIGAGGLFGEMSLFTGLPRTATGTVEDEAALIEIGAVDFAFLLERNPGVAEVMAGLVSDRNKKNEDFLRKIKELSEKDIAAVTDKKSILDRLKRLIKIGGRHT